MRLQSLEEAERVDPQSSEIKYRLALIYTVLQMREKAVAKFTQSIVLDPSNSPAYRDLARIYLAYPDEAMKKRGQEIPAQGGRDQSRGQGNLSASLCD